MGESGIWGWGFYCQILFSFLTTTIPAKTSCQNGRGICQNGRLGFFIEAYKINLSPNYYNTGFFLFYFSF